MSTRIAFFAVKVASGVIGLLFGVAAAAQVCSYLFGPQFLAAQSPSLLHLAVFIVLAALGVSIGLVGAMAIFVLPMTFLLPNAAKLFSWERRDPIAVYRFYQWYGKHLQAHGAEREQRAA